jgi:hypothetical protein
MREVCRRQTTRPFMPEGRDETRYLGGCRNPSVFVSGFLGDPRRGCDVEYCGYAGSCYIRIYNLLNHIQHDMFAERFHGRTLRCYSAVFPSVKA